MIAPTTKKKKKKNPTRPISLVGARPYHAIFGGSRPEGGGEGLEGKERE